MSGLYFTVWDELDILSKPTKSGWPHITFGSCGKKLSHSTLKQTAKDLYTDTVLKYVVLNEAFVPEGTNNVLLRVDPSCETAKTIERWRKLVNRKHLKGTFHMVDLHIVYQICETWKKANCVCNDINIRLPHNVQITGITID